MINNWKTVVLLVSILATCLWGKPATASDKLPLPSVLKRRPIGAAKIQWQTDNRSSTAPNEESLDTTGIRLEAFPDIHADRISTVHVQSTKSQTNLSSAHLPNMIAV